MHSPLRRGVAACPRQADMDREITDEFPPGVPRPRREVAGKGRNMAVALRPMLPRAATIRRPAVVDGEARFLPLESASADSPADSCRLGRSQLWAGHRPRVGRASLVEDRGLRRRDVFFPAGLGTVETDHLRCTTQPRHSRATPTGLGTSVPVYATRTKGACTVAASAAQELAIRRQGGRRVPCTMRRASTMPLASGCPSTSTACAGARHRRGQRHASTILPCSVAIIGDGALTAGSRLTRAPQPTPAQSGVTCWWC